MWLKKYWKGATGKVSLQCNSLLKIPQILFLKKLYSLMHFGKRFLSETGDCRWLNGASVRTGFGSTLCRLMLGGHADLPVILGSFQRQRQGILRTSWLAKLAEYNSETLFQWRWKVIKEDTGYQPQAFIHMHLHTRGHTDTHTGGNKEVCTFSLYKSTNLIVPITTIEVHFKTRWCHVECGYYNIRKKSPRAWKPFPETED